MTEATARNAFTISLEKYRRLLCVRGNSTVQRRMVAIALVYAGLLLLAILIGRSSLRIDVQALALAITLPGGGFLAWLDAQSAIAELAPYLATGAIVFFVLSLGLWFATGNVVLPPILWLSSALVATGIPAYWPQNFPPTPPAVAAWLPGALLAALGGAICLAIIEARRRKKWRRRFETAHSFLVEEVAAEPRPTRNEMSFDNLQSMRLLLDRALQPVERFDGFEWIDQFQTAAMRYQINFISYALSIATHAYLPAFEGYLAQAQSNLAAKQLDHRVWRYWGLENLWGNLAADRDPIARDNIMFSGFLAAQIAFAKSSTDLTDYDAPGSLQFNHPSGKSYRYSLPEIVERLTQRYRAAPLGLLACEPNWIYPLCNIMTASAIRATDAQFGTRNWDSIADTFRRRLENDFTSADGRLLAFRSSLTGFGTSSVGGALMQALPCLFVNAILPDVAERQWRRVRHDLTGPRRRRHLWPIDVGNYRLTRASSLAGTAAAAVELGDNEMAELLLNRLDAECPKQRLDGVAHRPGISVLSHALEVMARLGAANTLQTLAAKPQPRTKRGPFIKRANYPDVLIAAARVDGCGLHAVLYPGSGSGYRPLTIAGLLPYHRYVIDIGSHHPFSADAVGEASLQVPLHGRTELRIQQTA